MKVIIKREKKQKIKVIIFAILLSIISLYCVLLNTVQTIKPNSELKMAEHITEVPAGYVGIYTPDDLSNIRNNLSGKYILMQDIDMSSVENFEPIGSEGKPFKGILDGNGFKIFGYMPIRAISISDVKNNIMNLELKETNTKTMTAKDIAEEIASKNNVADYYGKIISGYTCPNNNYQWQIFYVGKNPNDATDEDHIYLTTTDYVKVAEWPNARNGTSPQNTEKAEYNTGYYGNFNNILLSSEYDGTLSKVDARAKKWLKINSSARKFNESYRIFVRFICLG